MSDIFSHQSDITDRSFVKWIPNGRVRRDVLTDRSPGPLRTCRQK